MPTEADQNSPKGSECHEGVQLEPGSMPKDISPDDEDPDLGDFGPLESEDGLLGKGAT